MRVPHTHTDSVWRQIGGNAFVDWIFILSVSFLTSLALIIFGLYLYWQVSSGNFHSLRIENTSAENIFNEKELNDTVNFFESKEDISVQIKRGYKGPADPSL